MPASDYWGSDDQRGEPYHRQWELRGGWCDDGYLPVAWSQLANGLAGPRRGESRLCSRFLDRRRFHAIVDHLPAHLVGWPLAHLARARHPLLRHRRDDLPAGTHPVHLGGALWQPKPEWG